MVDLPLCASGCGFFGTPQNKNLCSKCYNDFLKEEAAKHAANLVLRTVTPAIHKAEATAAGIVKNRCRVCKKKVGRVGFECRCHHVFCGSHRYPEEHSCPSDYKKVGREALAKNNPLVKAENLFKI